MSAKECSVSAHNAADPVNTAASALTTAIAMLAVAATITVRRLLGSSSGRVASAPVAGDVTVVSLRLAYHSSVPYGHPSSP